MAGGVSGGSILLRNGGGSQRQRERQETPERVEGPFPQVGRIFEGGNAIPWEWDDRLVMEQEADPAP